MSSRQIEELPYGDIIHRFSQISHLSGAILLDSGHQAHELARFDIISCEPSTIISAELRDELIAISIDGNATDNSDLFAVMSQYVDSESSQSPYNLPFIGGLMGYIGYDINTTLEKLNTQVDATSHLPIAFIGKYSWALVQDRVLQKAWLVAESSEALKKAQSIKQRILATSDQVDESFTLKTPLRSNFNQTQYRKAITTIKDYILAGDCYQVNLAQCFSGKYQGDPWTAYKALRQALPSPFSGYINTDNGSLLCLSPERFLLTEHNRIETRPIKGTRPRGINPEEDLQLAHELQNSNKDRAENLMIVDLLRNDLGRSCQEGSIRVEQLFALESYRNVHHLVSTISGQLAPQQSAIDALKNAFPGGSITGAPKVRAMEIINELEQIGRSAYCGSMFYLSNHGRLDSNITIRSVIADSDNLYCWGGGGIVADSDAQEEYTESLNKIQPILDTLKQFIR